MKPVDLSKIRFGRLVALRRDGTTKLGMALWLCLCDCGQSIVVRRGNLKTGNTRSCGCLGNEVRVESGHANKKHGLEGTPTYSSWHAMKNRCLSKSSKDFYRHGGRGITVCSSWLSFENFLNDMGLRPKGTSIDRINNDGPSCKANCRWATPKQQSNNRRNSIRRGCDTNTTTLPVGSPASVAGQIQ